MPPPSKKRKVVTPTLLFLFGVACLAYYLVMVVTYALFGERVAAWFSTPLFGIAVFFITRWETISGHENLTWRQYVKLPRLKIWKLALVLIAIFLVQALGGYAGGQYLYETRPDLIEDGFLEGMNSLLRTWGSAVMFLGGALASYFLGGYLAAKLSPHVFQSPYGHAAVAAFVFAATGTLIVQVLLICKCGTPPSQEDIGWAVLGIPPWVLLSLLGAWVGTRTSLLRSFDSLVKNTSSGARELSRGREFLEIRHSPTHAGVDPEKRPFARNETPPQTIVKHKRKREKKRKRR